MGSYNGGQSQGFTQRQGPPQYSGGGWGGSQQNIFTGNGPGGGVGSGFGSQGSGVGNQQTQYPMQPMGPNSTNVVTFDDTQRYQQGGGPLTGTGAAYDPTYRPDGSMRQSFADPSGYAAQTAARQAELAGMVDAYHRPGGMGGVARPGFGPPPPMTGGPDQMGNLLHGDPATMGGFGNLTPGMHGDPYGMGGMPGMVNALRGGGGGYIMPMQPNRNRNGY